VVAGGVFGVFSDTKTGVKRNKSDVNQDGVSIVNGIKDNRCWLYAGVFDGHGSYGHLVSDFLRKAFMKNLVAKFDAAKTCPDLGHALRDAFAMTNKQLESDSKIDLGMSGSTGCTLVINTANCELWTGNIGDSRAVLGHKTTAGWDVKPLSRDHVPNDPDEKDRIFKSGGRVQPVRMFNSIASGPHRVWLASEDLPGLAMSRSFGDKLASTVGVVSVPEVKRFVYGPADKFIVLASDGVWQYMCNEEVVAFVGGYYDNGICEGVCQRLVDRAVDKWKKRDNVVDDITCVIIYLKQP